MAYGDQYVELKKAQQSGRLEEQSQFLNAMQAFGQFMNQRKELEQNAPLKQAETEYKKTLANRVMNPIVTPYQQSQIQLNQARMNAMSGVNNIASDPNAVKQMAAQSSGFDPDDFNVKPIVRSVSGIPQTMFVPELKKEIPQTLFKEFQSMTKTASSLKQNLGMLDENEGEFAKEMRYFNPKAKRGGSFWGGIGTMLLKLDPKSKEFATFRAETDKAFQTYRKETTGAQAALAELGWLAPDFPETDDNPELYKQKAIEAIRRINEGEQLLLDNLSSQGYRTSGLKKLIESRAGGSQEQSSGAVPSVGGSFNGAKIIKVTRVK